MIVLFYFSFIVQFHLVSITQLTSFVLRHIRQTSNYLICATRTVLFFNFQLLLQFSSCFWAQRLITINLSPMIVDFFCPSKLMNWRWRDDTWSSNVIYSSEATNHMKRKLIRLVDLVAAFRAMSRRASSINYCCGLLSPRHHSPK